MQEDHITAVRRFNRFHTRVVGALNEKILATRYSLLQARILYELAQENDHSAADLSEILEVNPGYLSRQIAKLQSDGLILKRPDLRNAKRLILVLSQKGSDEFRALQEASIREVGLLLKPLARDERRSLVGSMQRIERLLGDRSDDRNYLLRNPEPGDMGWITHRNGVLYAREYGWDWTFEALVGRIVADFTDNFDPKFERCWIAEREGEIVGSVFVVRESDEVAKLRLLYVEPDARGLGIGGRLVKECTRFARDRRYRKLVLWTNDVLGSARKIYQAAGFTLVAEEAHHSFGQDLVGQNWELQLHEA